MGRLHTEEEKKLMSKNYKYHLPKHAFKKGCTPWNKGLKGVQKNTNKGKKGLFKHTDKYKQELSERMQGNHNRQNKINPESMKEKQRKTMKKMIAKNPQWIKKCLKRNPMSSLELKFQEIVKKYNLPYRFVGNGEFIIGRKCPDFINTNGQKIAIEVYYSKHKEKFHKGLNKWMKERQEIFNTYGWKIEFFNETQVNKNEILRRID